MLDVIMNRLVWPRVARAEARAAALEAAKAPPGWTPTRKLRLPLPEAVEVSADGQRFGRLRLPERVESRVRIFATVVHLSENARDYPFPFRYWRPVEPDHSVAA